MLEHPFSRLCSSAGRYGTRPSCERLARLICDPANRPWMLCTICMLRRSQRLGGADSGTGSVSGGEICQCPGNPFLTCTTGSSSHCSFCMEETKTLWIPVNQGNVDGEEVMLFPFSRHARSLWPSICHDHDISNRVDTHQQSPK